MAEDPGFASEKPKTAPSRIKDVLEIKRDGPYRTKSEGVLNVLFAFPEKFAKYFLEQDKNEAKRLPKIKGLRIYTVEKLNKGEVGGKEFHRIRKEVLYVLQGKLRFECEDVYGKKRRFVLTPKKGIFIPPFVLHTYWPLENNSKLMVVANTLFFVGKRKKKVSDTYSLESFKKLQKVYRDVK